MAHSNDKKQAQPITLIHHGVQNAHGRPPGSLSALAHYLAAG
ncbi:MAG TPA: hypothetical protein PLE10_02775 [Brevefilum sp.]|nr:hypothetical protein [Brevefilum sp.]HOR18739.1 hypothetical protein [Brevefilum sp.]HPL68640.1 hypothetical protein [Brevefilum sp.]